MSKDFSSLTLPNLSLTLKSLFTGYILVVGLGLLMAGFQILQTHGMADGKFGVSVDDIVYSYYGNRNGSKLEAKLNGSMKDKASPEERLTIIKWARNGADKNQYEQNIKPIIEQRCAICHGAAPSLVSFNSYSEIMHVAEVDQGVSVSSLTRVSHIHLFGISFIFFFIGFIFSMAIGFNKITKAIIIFFPFLFLIVDISAWWLTKFDPAFAWLVIIGGIGYSIASTIMILTSLYQMWICPLRSDCATDNDWVKD